MSSFPLSDFRAGFTARHALSDEAFGRAFAAAPTGFAAVDPAPTAPVSFAPQSSITAPPTAPKHFAPTDRARNPTQGWNPLDPSLDQADPFAAAHAAGYAQGLAATRAAVDAAGERDRALLGGLLDQLAAGKSIDREAIAAQLRQTVLLLVGKLVGEVGVSPELLAGRIGQAADHLADAAESALLRVHPDDVALLEARLPANLFAVGDPNVARGSFVLESASTVVEDGPALWLEQLAGVVDKVAVPGC